MKIDKKKIIGGIFLIFLVFIMINLLDQESGIITIIRLQKKSRELHKNIMDSIMVRDSLKKVVDKLQKDTSYIERIAREKYGMSRSNERIYKFVEEKRE
ncbi:MAG: septum formation initiator family protein [Chitinispirillaceae bacterium]|nr:septum formation initiator family protein [Chitinispirillaceae bacterium]